MEEDINKQLSEISNKLDDIMRRVESMEKDMEYVRHSADNMNKHISFIERVYSAIKSPFQRLMGGWLPEPTSAIALALAPEPEPTPASPRHCDSSEERSSVRNLAVVPTPARGPCE